jgi:hypothetical protein
VSRSWIERARRALEPSARAGLALGRDYAGFARLGAADGGWRVVALDEARLETPLFTGAPTREAGAALAKALGALAGTARGRYLPLHVSVPDALVRWATFELDELPNGSAARLDLVRFRFGRQGTNGSHAYACQPLERDGATHLLFGMALDEAWRALVTAALEETGIVPWSLSGNACRQFNRFHDTLAQSSGALVALAPDAWSLWMWDDAGRPRYGRGRWRDAAADHGHIALEVERAILAYVHGRRGCSVARVFLVGGAETEAMAAALDARLREPCVRLPADDGGVTGADPRTASAAVALAAALER